MMMKVKPNKNTLTNFGTSNLTWAVIGSSWHPLGNRHQQGRPSAGHAISRAGHQPGRPSAEQLVTARQVISGAGHQQGRPSAGQAISRTAGIRTQSRRTSIASLCWDQVVGLVKKGQLGCGWSGEAFI